MAKSVSHHVLTHIQYNIFSPQMKNIIIEWKDTCAQSRDLLPANNSNEVKKNAENYNNDKNCTEFCVNEVSPPRKYITITDLRLTVQSSTCFKMFVREGLLTCYSTFLYGQGPKIYLDILSVYGTFMCPFMIQQVFTYFKVLCSF